MNNIFKLAPLIGNPISCNNLINEPDFKVILLLNSSAFTKFGQLQLGN